MVQKSSDHQLRLVGYPIIYSVFFTFQVVVWDFWTINSIFLNWLVVYHPPPWNWVTHRISGFRLGPNDSHRGFFPWIEIPKSFCQQKKVCFSTTSSEPNLSAGQAFQNYSLPQWKIRHKFFFGSRPNSSPNFLENFWSPFFSRQGTGPNAIWIHYLCAQAITNGNPVVCGPRVEKDHLQLAIFGDFFSMGSLPCRKETTTGLPTIHLFRGLLS